MIRFTRNRAAAPIAATALIALVGCGTDPGYEDSARTERSSPSPATTRDQPAAAAVEPGTPSTLFVGPELPSDGPVATEASEATGAVEGSEAIETIEPAADPHAAYVEAEALYLEGDRDRAIPLLRASIAARPDFVHAHYLLGLSLRKTGDLEGAEASLRRTLEMRPAHVRARTNLARVLIDTGRPEEAIDSLDVAVANGEDGADLWNVRGLARLALGELDTAADDFRAAIDRAPSNVYALNNLGLVEIRRGRFEEAIAPLQHATEITGAPAYVFNNLGMALERTGALTGAAGALEEAVARGHAHAARSLSRVSAELEMLARQGGGADPEPTAVDPETEVDEDASLAAVSEEADPSTP